MINRLAKRILLFLNWIAIFLFVLGFLAGKISPASISILIIFSLSFHILVIINGLFILFWIIFRKYYFLFSLAALALMHKPVLDTFNGFSKKTSNAYSKSFTVLSYNVKVFDLYNWRHNKKSRNEIFKFVRSVAPDIACFQEYFNSSNNYFPVHDSLSKHQKFNYSHIFYSEEMPNGHNFGIATYSAFPIIKKTNISFGKTHNLAIASDIKIGDDTIRIINCHLESVKFLKEDYNFIDSLPGLTNDRNRKSAQGVIKRLKKASTIRALQTDLIAQHIQDSPYSVMLCGDFNDVPASYTYQTLRKGMTDSFKYSSMGLGGTYPRFFPPLRIDFILFSKPIQCNHFERIHTNLSDHYPVYGTYLLP